jgi:hypothetical protein|tara:strand:- start:141 stop:359 length:219 start_codon:yes stop_codon:yes gene_type:complete
MKRLLASLCLVVLIGLTPVYKNFKGKQLCLQLKNDQLSLEKVKKLEEYSGVEGRAVFDYCAKIGVINMATES